MVTYTIGTFGGQEIIFETYLLCDFDRVPLEEEEEEEFGRFVWSLPDGPQPMDIDVTALPSREGSPIDADTDGNSADDEPDKFDTFALDSENDGGKYGPLGASSTGFMDVDMEEESADDQPEKMDICIPDLEDNIANCGLVRICCTSFIMVHVATIPAEIARSICSSLRRSSSSRDQFQSGVCQKYEEFESQENRLYYFAPYKWGHCA
jgi:hypothetical protein